MLLTTAPARRVRRANVTLADFDVEGRIGDGSFSEVMQVCAGFTRPLHIVVLSIKTRCAFISIIFV
jgi:hypothetical protein